MEEVVAVKSKTVISRVKVVESVYVTEAVLAAIWKAVTGRVEVAESVYSTVVVRLVNSPDARSFGNGEDIVKDTEVLLNVRSTGVINRLTVAENVMDMIKDVFVS